MSCAEILFPTVFVDLILNYGCKLQLVFQNSTLLFSLKYVETGKYFSDAFSFF